MQKYIGILIGFSLIGCKNSNETNQKQNFWCTKSPTVNNWNPPEIDPARYCSRQRKTCETRFNGTDFVQDVPCFSQENSYCFSHSLNSLGRESICAPTAQECMDWKLVQKFSDNASQCNVYEK